MRHALSAFTKAAFLSFTVSACIVPAIAQEAPAQQQELKLFGGVVHKEALPHADALLKAHREKIEKLKALVPAKDTEHKVPPPTKPAAALKANAIAESKLQSPPTAPPQRTKQVLTNPPAPVTAAYNPAFGVARPSTEQPHPMLKAEVAQQHYTVQWFMIPLWMAGTWIKDGDLTTKLTNLRTGQSSYSGAWTENRLQAQWGHQVDRQGNIWHVNLLPAERDGLSAGKQVRFLTVAQECERSTPADLVTRTHYVVTESQEWSGQPIDTFQQESINHYALNADRELINTSSNRVFSYSGQPERDGELVSKFRKIAEFTPTALMGGIDLKASLSDYLRSIGRQ